jgi:multiple sugar transport system ATP-binding protein
MSLALKQEDIARDEIERRVNSAAEMLALSPLLKRRPAALSGGERQRVAIGRALVRQPKLLLFDEPLSNLDAALRGHTRIEIANLHRTLGATMLYVTHDQIEAMTLADKIVVLHAGTIQQVGRPVDLYNLPVNLFVAGFIGSPKMNFIEGEEAGREEAKTLGIRPEHIRIVSDNVRWRGVVRHTEYLGSDSYLYVKTEAAGELTVRVVGEADAAIGDKIGLAPQPSRMLRFDDKGLRMDGTC